MAHNSTMNGMEYQELLGRYSEREIAFMKETKPVRSIRGTGTDAMGGLIPAGRSMDSEHYFFPPTSEISDYIKNAMRSINGDAE